MLPRAGHGGDGQGRVHGGAAIALAGEAVAEAEIGARGGADEPGESLDLARPVRPVIAGRPFGRAGRLRMRFELGARNR